MNHSYYILVIEDSKTYAELATAMLEQLGHRVKLAGSVEQGLEMARYLVPDLILTDINLPGMSGFDGVRALRRDPELRETPVVGMTLSQPVDAVLTVHGLRAGFNGFMEKPHDLEGFAHLVESYLPMGPR